MTTKAFVSMPLSEQEVKDLFLALTGENHLAATVKSLGLNTIPALVERLRVAVGNLPSTN
jgi:hypothetical protein